MPWPPLCFEGAFQDETGKDFWFYKSGQHASVFKTLYLSEGESLSGWAQFSSNENYPRGHDFMTLAINDRIVLKYDTAERLDPEPWSFTAEQSGLYAFSLTGCEETRNWYQVWDIHTSSASIPEPSASALLALAGVLVWLAKRF
jgi:hypothetical protein